MSIWLLVEISIITPLYTNIVKMLANFKIYCIAIYSHHALENQPEQLKETDLHLEVIYLTA